MYDTLLKICGLSREIDIEIINKYLVDFAGFIIDYPKSHRSIAVNELKILTANLNRDKTKAVGVFVNEPLEIVADLLNKNIIDIAQLHGDEDDSYVDILKHKTGKTIIKAFIIREKDDIEKALKTKADFPLLDAGKGQGLVFNHNWALSFKRDFFLAGGLNNENILQTIEKLKPYAVDLSSSLEDNSGYKSESKIKDIVKIVKSDIRF